MSGTLLIVQTTLPGELNEAEVGMWCQPIIDSNLAACVDIKRTNSVFRWEGEIQNIAEWEIQMKTSESNKSELISRIKSEHSYDVPQIIWWTVQSTKEYYDWVQG
jgi:periplasmic divalent cation tolerance protein|tara:strand:+ start:665 stop:979 length:315 start_codon:yes stop_codon:yes gene_type:complete